MLKFTKVSDDLYQAASKGREYLIMRLPNGHWDLIRGWSRTSFDTVNECKDFANQIEKKLGGK